MKPEDEKRLDEIENDLERINELTNNEDDIDVLMMRAEINLRYLLVRELGCISHQIYEINHFGLGDF